MVKKIDIDASDNPDLARKVFSVAMGVKPLPDDLSDNRSGKQIVHDMAKEIGVSKAEGERLARKVLQREILTEGVNAKLGRSFNDPLDIRKDNGRMPSFSEVMERASRFDGSADRAEFAAQAIKDGRVRPPISPEVLKEILSAGIKPGINGFLEWAKEGETILQSAQTSSLHKLQTAYDAKFVLTLDRTDDAAQMVKLTPSYDQFFAEVPQVFLVQHDWAKAFEKADGLDGEVPLPFEHCAFEFQISGRRLIVLCNGHVTAIFIELNGTHFWYAGRVDTLDEMSARETDEPGTFSMLGIFMGQTIRSMCIALDAEVAVTEVIRAPHRLNHQRERQGKKPVLDHHVVNLAKRSRVEPLPSTGDHEARWHPRLHFRRGHWRHFENHRTWIKWMLVGAADLGFIDKEYRA